MEFDFRREKGEGGRRENWTEKSERELDRKFYWNFGVSLFFDFLDFLMTILRGVEMVVREMTSEKFSKKGIFGKIRPKKIENCFGKELSILRF